MLKATLIIDIPTGPRVQMRKLIAGLIKWKPKSERASPSRTVVPPHEIAVRHAQAREEEQANTVAVEPAHGGPLSKASASKGPPGRGKKRGERKREQSRERVPVQAEPEVEDPLRQKVPSARIEENEALTRREAPTRKRKRRANDPAPMQEKVGGRRAKAPGLAAREARGGGAKSKKARRRLRQMTFGGNLLQDAQAPTDKRRKKVNRIKKIRKATGEEQPGRVRRGTRRKTRLDHL